MEEPPIMISVGRKMFVRILDCLPNLNELHLNYIHWTEDKDSRIDLGTPCVKALDVLVVSYVSFGGKARGSRAAMPKRHEKIGYDFRSFSQFIMMFSCITRFEIEYSSISLTLDKMGDRNSNWSWSQIRLLRGYSGDSYYTQHLSIPSLAFQGFLYELGNRLQFLDLSHFFDGSTIGDTKDVPLDLSRNTGLLELRVKVFISPKNCRAFNDAINAIVSLKSARFSALYLTIRPIKYSDSEIDVNWSLLDIFLEKQESMKGVNIYLNLDRDDNRGKFTKDKLESMLERGLPLTIAKELLFLEEVQLNHLEETEDEGL
ncbi:hypothetical protein ABKN59_011463 [Abortiporus biennis]